MRNLTKEDVAITVTPEEEDSLYDCGFEPDLINSFIDAIDNYGLWGFCCVNVTVRWNNISATSYLGHCSYKDKEDFIETSGYYNQMVNDALVELNKEVKEIAEEIQKLN